jgi:hypothetical protein
MQVTTLRFPVVFGLAACLLLTGPAALAQEDGNRRQPPAATSGGDDGRTAVPRQAPAPSPAPPATATPRATAPATEGGGQAAARPRSGSDRAPTGQPRVAVPRGAQAPAPPPRTIIVGYPRYGYPYGYGGFGLGYFYYDPYAWYGPSRVVGYGPTGQVRLRVEPKDAEVYVDGYYAGVVDDFNGIFQGLRLEEGGYTIEIVAPGYDPLEVRLRIQPGRRITYRGELTPQQAP